MTATQKIEYIEKQIKAVIDGRTNVIHCPFCHGENRKPSLIEMDASVSPICCNDFAAAQEAAILKLETDLHLEQAERIANSMPVTVH